MSALAIHDPKFPEWVDVTLSVNNFDDACRYKLSASFNITTTLTHEAIVRGNDIPMTALRIALAQMLSQMKGDVDEALANLVG